MLNFLDSNRRKALRRITLTPLADLVFILLVFFILETNFSEHFQISHEMPSSVGASASVAQSLRVELFPGGLAWINNRSVRVQELDEYLSEKKLPKDTSVTLEVHQRSRLQTLIQALDHLYAANLKNTQIVSVEKTSE